MGGEAQDASSRCWAVWLLRPCMRAPGIMNPLLCEERTGPGGADERAASSASGNSPATLQTSA